MALCGILTKEQYILEKYQKKEKDFEFLGRQTVGNKYMGNLMEDKGCLVKCVMQISLCWLSDEYRVPSGD